MVPRPEGLPLGAMVVSKGLMESRCFDVSCPGCCAARRIFAAWCAADPGPTRGRHGSRLCGAPFHAAPRPGHESALHHRLHAGQRVDEIAEPGAADFEIAVLVEG